MGQKVCNTCRDRHERAYRAAKEVLLCDPNASFKEIAKETGFDIELIKQLCKEELIHVVNAADGALECERCGREILEGHICEWCEQDLRGMLNTMGSHLRNSAQAQTSQKSRGGFHTREK